MFKSLQSKLGLLLILGLSLLQFSLVLLMTHQAHENICAFDEHCILQSVVVGTEAAVPLLTLVLPVFFVLLFSPKFVTNEAGLYRSPPNAQFLKILKGVIQRE